jgi:o-succinylbenzoate synthase
MKITRIQPIPIALPLRKPMRMAGRTYERLDTVVVRLETEGRLAGWGEASAAPQLTGETVPSIVAAVNLLADALVGSDVRDLGRVGAIIASTLVGNPAAKASVEVAAFDAVGRNAGLPLHALLGGRRATEFDCLYLLGAGDPALDLAEARRKVDEGFTALKYKVANGNLIEEAETLVALRRQLGHGVMLGADANGGWSRGQASLFLNLARESAAAFIEQPVAADDYVGMSQVAATSTLPIAADESIHSIADLSRLIETRGALGGSLKIMKLAGLVRCLDACRLTHALGGEINLSGKVGETSIANAATLAVAAVWGRPSWGLSLTNNYLVADPVKQPLQLEGGRAHSLDGPGLGVEIDESQLEKLATA